MYMKVDVLLGLQWGDEGKGKIVDVLTPQYDIIARFQGGPNAGHSLEFNGIKHVLHLLPSGIFHEDKINFLGNGMVICPIAFKKEVEALLPYIPMEELKKRIVISDRAKLILPVYRILDKAQEAAKGNQKIGTTGKGIGPTYGEHIGRNAIRVGDICRKGFTLVTAHKQSKHCDMLNAINYPFDMPSLIQEIDEFSIAAHFMQEFKIVNGAYWINEQLNAGKKILAEGAQGTFLDIDFGTYPYVTSSNTIAAGVCTGLGIAPNRIGEVYGLFKAYTTRVGEGPFPTEKEDKEGEMMQRYGNEFGSTTGRPRRCGWLDMIMLKYAVMINGVTKLIMSKADVLSDHFEYVYMCDAYEIDIEGERRTIREVPLDMDEIYMPPLYNKFIGWSSLNECETYSELPRKFMIYVEQIEYETGVPIKIISTGPDRTQIIVRE